jgi:hypothetical protein
MKNEFSKIEQPCTIHSVNDNTSGILVECCDCRDKHYKHQRIVRKQGAWETYHCPKCDSESFYRL